MVRGYFEDENCGFTELYLVVHDLDGVNIRSEISYLALAYLAESSNIYLVGFIDQINAALLWDKIKSTRFNWLYHDATTYGNYLKATSFEKTLILGSTEHDGARGRHKMEISNLNRGTDKLVCRIINIMKISRLTLRIDYNWEMHSQLTEFKVHQIYFRTSITMSSDKKPRSIFSTTINDLVRSAIGGNARQVSDQDLDSYVADLITTEAQAKQAKYKTHGVRAYQPNPEVPQPSSNPLKPNKRFLMNIVKATDSHNQSVIREAEEKAKAFQEKRRKQEQLNSNNTSSQQYRHIDNEQHSRKRKRSHHSDDDDQQSSGISMNSNDDSHSNSSEDENDHVTRIQYRGRGKIRNGTSMDKYFEDDYDAAKDMDSDQDTTDQSSHKKGKKAKKSRHKLSESTKSKKSSKSNKKKKRRHHPSKKSKRGSSK